MHKIGQKQTVPPATEVFCMRYIMYLTGAVGCTAVLCLRKDV